MTAPRETPRASVLMSVFDERPDFLGNAVRSVLAQTMADFELVLLDDGSTRPETLAALDRLAAEDSRIRLRHEAHRGLTAALNVGLALCRAPLVCRHDSDDWSEPRRLERQVEFMDQHPELGLVGSFWDLHQENGLRLWSVRQPVTREEVHRALPELDPFCHGAACFRRSAAQAVGGYREVFSTCQDYDFFWRLADAFGACNLPEVLYHHRITAGAVSSLRAEQQVTNRRLIRQVGQLRRRGQAEDFAAASQAPGAVLTDCHCRAGLQQADRLLLAGHYRRAMAAYGRSLRDWPTSLLCYGKLARCLLFVLLPEIRSRLFLTR